MQCPQIRQSFVIWATFLARGKLFSIKVAQGSGYFTDEQNPYILTSFENCNILGNCEKLQQNFGKKLI